MDKIDLKGLRSSAKVGFYGYNPHDILALLDRLKSAEEKNKKWETGYILQFGDDYGTPTIDLVNAWKERALSAEAKVAQIENFKPTFEATNNLPECIRKYIHDIETTCDPAGTVADLAAKDDNINGLTALVRELKAENAKLRELLSGNNGCRDFVCEKPEYLAELHETVTTLRKRLAAAEVALKEAKNERLVDVDHMTGVHGKYCCCAFCTAYRRWQAMSKADGQATGGKV